ncbi:MAG: penicillin-binding protein 1A [Oxalobacter sp.]|jgi:penicillin-binding protein 1A|nr:penicillin-binding protein 1A [Oxalobacter sp.]
MFSRNRDPVPPEGEEGQQGEPSQERGRRRGLWFWVVTLFVGGALLGVLLVGLTVAIIYPQLPSMDRLTDYRPKMPLRVYTSDNVLIGEFGDERRKFVPIEKIPQRLKKAVLAIEDDRFYQHSGIDYLGILRAAINNVLGRSRQGASTITQQVAKNFFLSSEQTLKRKMYEAVLAFKIEKALSKDKILELYMNQIYLGQRSFGFAMAAQTYFGKELEEITLAEAAMLAGLPKAPSANNPISNFPRAKQRQEYILLRMQQLGYISQQEYENAVKEELHIKMAKEEPEVHGRYVAEMVRLMVFQQYGDATYTSGMNVYTTISGKAQEAAYRAVRRGAIDYDRRHGYRGPEGYIALPSGDNVLTDQVKETLEKHPASEGLISGVVTEASPSRVKVMLPDGKVATVTGAGLKFAASCLGKGGEKQIKRGSIIRIGGINGEWAITQLPQIEAALVALDPADGAIRALIGGFDFANRQFNHATQAWRQPGSSFKPFIYSAALEKGFAPASIINDAPMAFTAGSGQTWNPKNYDNVYDGPMTMRRGLMKSKNMISVQILNHIGPTYGQDHAVKFGFDYDKVPADLSLALGAASVTPLQMASAYAIFANGGFRVKPYLISSITDFRGKVLSRANPEQPGLEINRAIDARNAFVMDSMMKGVVLHGTAAKAGKALARTDLAGKTGTTNDSHDVWFAGYQQNLVAVVWLGFDQPKNMGHETGGSLAVPVWIDFMRVALQGLPSESRPMPEGLDFINDDYYYREFPPGEIVTNVGVSNPVHPTEYDSF